MEPIVTIIRRRRLKWYEHLKVRHETENIRAVAEMMMEGKCPTENIRALAEMVMEGKRPKGRRSMRWKETVRRDTKT